VTRPACQRCAVSQPSRPCALQQIEHLMDQAGAKHCVLADAGYGVDTAFRDRLTELGCAMRSG